MGILYEIRSSARGLYQVAIPSQGYRYQFADGTQWVLNHAPAWCDHCQAIRNCELLPTEIQLYRGLFTEGLGRLTDEEFSRIYDNEEKRTSVARRILVRAEASGFSQALDMIHQRQSPPRCLSCGNIELEWPDEGGVLLLKTGELLTLASVGFVEIWGIFGVYSPEGERIGDSSFSGSA